MRIKTMDVSKTASSSVSIKSMQTFQKRSYSAVFDHDINDALQLTARIGAFAGVPDKLLFP